MADLNSDKFAPLGARRIESEHEHSRPEPVVRSTHRESTPQDRIFDFTTSTAPREEAIELAFDYRGDVTITRHDGSEIVGYVFDRRTDRQSGKALIRVMTESGEKIPVEVEQITRIVFTGRDTALGKSWESWVRRVAEKMRNT